MSKANCRDERHAGELMRRHDSRIVSEMLIFSRQSYTFYCRGLTVSSGQAVRNLYRNMVWTRAAMVASLYKLFEDKTCQVCSPDGELCRRAAWYAQVVPDREESAFDSPDLLQRIYREEQRSLVLLKDRIRNIGDPELSRVLAYHVAAMQIVNDQLANLVVG